MTALIASACHEPTETERLVVPSGRILGSAPTSMCQAEPAPSIARHRNGLSPMEVRRIRDAAWFMRQRGPLQHFTVGDALYDLAMSEARELVSSLTSMIGLYGRRDDLPGDWLVVWETDPEPHAHILAGIETSRNAAFLNGKFSELFAREKAIRPVGTVTDLMKLVGYLSKEATTQAAWACDVRRKRNGRFLLPGDGDRVRLAPVTRKDGIAAGKIEPWKRTNAKRSAVPRRKQLPASLRPELIVPDVLVESSGQCAFNFPAPRAASERLERIRSGRLSPLAALELRHAMARHGLTQASLAERAGLRQPTISNLLRGEYGASADTLARLRTVLDECRRSNLAGVR